MSSTTVNVKTSFVVILSLLILAFENGCHSRYLPTRNYGDNVEKLRELMYQILESSSESHQHQQLPPQLFSSSVTSPLLSSSSQHDRGLQRPKSNYGFADNQDVPLSVASPSASLRGDRSLRNGVYDANARLKFLLKHPQQFLSNLDQLV